MAAAGAVLRNKSTTIEDKKERNKANDKERMLNEVERRLQIQKLAPEGKVSQKWNDELEKLPGF